MKIFIVGLGLMGASYAQGLSRTGHKVYGFDRNQSVCSQAQKDGVIISSDLNLMRTSDLVVLALYPKDNIDFVKEHLSLFGLNQLITDISGTKTQMIQEINDLLPKGVRYLSHHPMAGKEKSGYEAKDSNIFIGANFMIVQTPRSTDQDELILRTIAKDLNFGKIIVVDPVLHDQLIAYTSQLTHLLAVGLMHGIEHEKTNEATGDSFRDLTRIAKINEYMWTELFIDNKIYVSQAVDTMIETLNHLKKIILNEDHETLKTYLKQAKEKRKQFD